MDLHDSVIWAVRFDDNLYFDIDIVLGSLDVQGEVFHKVQPATFVFYDVENFNIQIETDWINGFEVNKVLEQRLSDQRVKWQIQFQEGLLSFSFSKYERFFKGDEAVVKETCLSEEVRGGYNFNRANLARRKRSSKIP